MHLLYNENYVAIIKKIQLHTYFTLNIHSNSIQIWQIYHHSIIGQCKVTVLCGTNTHLKLKIRLKYCHSFKHYFLPLNNMPSYVHQVQSCTWSWRPTIGLEETGSLRNTWLESETVFEQTTVLVPLFPLIPITPMATRIYASL